MKAEAATICCNSYPHTGGVEQKTVRGYRPELDVVRFLAFFLVFIHHQFSLSATPVKSERLFVLIGQGAWDLFLAFGNACAMGLCLFFTLSAYLITSLLLEERENYTVISVKKFYIRRVLRIWPLYVWGIIIGITIAIVHHSSQQVTAFVWFLLFSGNIYIAVFGAFSNPMTPLWSISVEEQFYLVWPWAMRWLSRRGLIMCAALFIIVANCTLFILGQHHADTYAEVWANTFVQFEMFATGILLALAKKQAVLGNALFGSGLAITGPLLWLVACFVFHVRQAGNTGLAANGVVLMVGYGLVAVGCAVILQGFSMIGPSRMPQWATRLGKISYGLYVYHMLAGTTVQAILSRLHIVHSYGTYIPLSLLLTILAAKCSYAWLESPFLGLKRRFEIVHTRPI